MFNTNPKIRFREFTDNWEQRKLGDVTEYIKGFAFKSKDYRKSGIRIIRVSDLTRDKIKRSNDDIFVSMDLAELNKKYRINKNEIIITTVGSKAEMKESAVGRPIIVNENGHYLLNQNLVKISALQGYDNYFIYSQLLQPRYTAYIAMIERGNANQANIAIRDLWKYQFLAPEEVEQRQIGTFFKTLDNTIALHQSELEKLTQFKQAMLRKMFPKDGEKEPEIRFEGFEGQWEEYKMGDIASIGTGYTPPRKDSSNFGGGITWISVADMKDKYVSKSAETLTKIAIRDGKWVEPNTLIMSFKLTVGRVAITKIKCMTNEAIANFIWKYDTLSNDYMLHYLSSIDVSKYGNAATQGISLNADSLKKIKVIAPVVEEQKLIGGYFDKIDKSIDSKKSELTKLKQFKKAMLNKMFI